MLAVTTHRDMLARRVILAVLVCLCGTLGCWALPIPVGNDHPACVRPFTTRNSTLKHGEQAQSDSSIDIHCFRVTLSDPRGFFSDQSRWQSSTLGQRRRQIINELFTDMAASVGGLNSDTIRTRLLCEIEIVTTHDPQEPAAAWAEPVWVADGSENSIICDAAPLTLLRYELRPPRELADYFGPHGRIVINTAKLFGVELNSCPPDRVDLYSVLLHELVHVMGIASIAGQDCLQAGSVSPTPYVSRWDALLMSADSRHLLGGSCGDLTFQIPSGLRGACTVQPVFRRDGTEFFVSSGATGDCVSDFSHLTPLDRSDTVLMSQSLSRGQMRRTLYRADYYSLRALGYPMQPFYGAYWLAQSRIVTYEYDRSIPATARPDTLLALARTPGQFVVTQDSIRKRLTGVAFIDCIDLVRPFDGLHLTHVTNSIVLSDSVGRAGSATLRLQVRDSLGRRSSALLICKLRSDIDYRIDDLPCPPNRICNGGFETNSRSGNGFLHDSSDCFDPTPISNWKYEFGSTQLFKVESSYPGSIEPPVYPNIVNGLEMFAYPRNFLDGRVNHSYVFALSHGATGGPPDYYEGLQQQFYATAGTRAQVYLWAYTYTPPTTAYTRNAALRVSIADQPVCGFAVCDVSRGNILDDVLILPVPNTWVPLWSSPVVFPRDGWYSLVVATTNCFLASPQYGQGTTGHCLFDDVQLCTSFVAKDTWLAPSSPCSGDTATVIATLSNITAEPAEVAWSLTPGSGLHLVGSSMGSFTIAAGQTTEVALAKVASNLRPGLRSMVQTIYTTISGGRSVYDTASIDVTSGKPTVELSVTHARTVEDGIRMYADIAALQPRVIPFEGTITWSHALGDSVEIRFPDSSGLDISNVFRSGNSSSVVFRGSVSPSSSPRRLMVDGVRVRRVSGTSSTTPDRMTIVVRASEATCTNAVTVSGPAEVVVMNEGAGAMLRPNPASDYVRLDFADDLGQVYTVRLLTLDGRSVRTLPFASAMPWMDLSITDVAAGAYYVIIEAERRSAAIPLLIVR